MHYNIGNSGYAALYSAFYPVTYIMGPVNMHIGAHLNVEINMYVILSTARPYFVTSPDAFNGHNNVHNPVIIRYHYLIAKDPGTIFCDRKSRIRYKERYHDGHYGIQDRITQLDHYHRDYYRSGREYIGFCMQRIGYKNIAIKAFACLVFIGHDEDIDGHSYQHNYHAYSVDLRRCVAMQTLYALAKKIEAYKEEHPGDRQGKECFIFFMPIRMVLIRRAACERNADEAYYIGSAVGERVKSVGHHAREVRGVAVEYLGQGHAPIQYQDDQQDAFDISKVLLLIYGHILSYLLATSFFCHDIINGLDM